MSSFPRRDPQEDRLLTPQNSALVVIDYQPTQINSINSISKDTLIRNIVTVVRIAQVYSLPTVLSTVNVLTGRNKDTVPRLKSVLADIPTYDRTSINAWEDKDFYNAVLATGRRKLILCALWTEACLTFPTIDAIAEGFDIYPVSDAVGGTSITAHRTALHRIEQAGAHLVTIPQL
ncbi:MAG: isochorismatase family protein, partial [Bifidobacteriaceae bacterium]|nr:isochorismatase family protein [Bifidobacteriaceae bacterium]